jgi:hypothetical protein
VRHRRGGQWETQEERKLGESVHGKLPFIVSQRLKLIAAFGFALERHFQSVLRRELFGAKNRNLATALLGRATSGRHTSRSKTPRPLSNWIESKSALAFLVGRISGGKPVSNFPENAPRLITTRAIPESDSALAWKAIAGFNSSLFSFEHEAQYS